MVKAGKDLESRGQEIERAEAHLRVQQDATSLIFKLTEAITEHPDASAFEALLSIAVTATAILHCYTKDHRDKLQFVAQNQFMWPVLATVSSDWAQKANDEIQSLRLGRNVLTGTGLGEKSWRPRLSIAAQYAKQIVDTIQYNRVFLIAWAKHYKAHKDIPLGQPGGPDFILAPDWAFNLCKLPPLNKKTVKQWMRAAKEMIRASCPDFQCRPEWNDFTESAKRRLKAGGKIDGRKRSDIFKAIEDAMMTMAID